MSKYAGHTSGPWFVHDFRSMKGGLSVSCTTPDHVTVADVGRGLTNTLEEEESNANLIAAAPKLLEQRDRLRESIKNHRWKKVVLGHDDEDDRKLYAALQEVDDD